MVSSLYRAGAGAVSGVYSGVKFVVSIPVAILKKVCDVVCFIFPFMRSHQDPSFAGSATAEEVINGGRTVPLSPGPGSRGAPIRDFTPNTKAKVKNFMENLRTGGINPKKKLDFTEHPAGFIPPKPTEKQPPSWWDRVWGDT